MSFKCSFSILEGQLKQVGGQIKGTEHLLLGVSISVMLSMHVVLFLAFRSRASSKTEQIESAGCRTASNLGLEIH